MFGVESWVVSWLTHLGILSTYVQIDGCDCTCHSCLGAAGQPKKCRNCLCKCRATSAQEAVCTSIDVSQVALAALAVLAGVLLVGGMGAGILYHLWSRKESIAKALTEGRDDKLLRRLARAANLRLQSHVFISHCGHDKLAKNFAASILEPQLRQRGLQVKIDFKSLVPGQDWAQELITHAANSEVFVAVLSEAYSKRFWCMLELDLALNAHAQRQQLWSDPGSRPKGGPHIAAGCNMPLIIPVFIDDNSSIVQPEAIQKFWEAISQAADSTAKLEAAGLGSPTDLEWVDPSAWAANVVHMLKVQHLRLASFSGKDALLQLAIKVSDTAEQHIKSGAPMAVLWGALRRLKRWFCI